MVHEVPDCEAFFREVRDPLKAGCTDLVFEPVLHGSRTAFNKTVD
jgi:hypothetical protein